MSKPIDFQIISENGEPKFAVVPIEEFRSLMLEANREPTIPHGVVHRLVDDNISPVRAWREHIGLTQTEVASRLGISQAAFAQKESPDANLRPKSLQAIANAFGITREQLDV